MSSGLNRLGSHALFSTPVESAPPSEHAEEIRDALDRTVNWMFDRQADDGYWCGELEGDTILESEYILLLAFLGRGQSEVALKAAEYIRRQQLPCGGWAMYPGGPLEISGSVKAYWALKITGHDPQADYMVRAREAIRAAGGAEKVNSFTRYYFALLGIIAYRQCPAVPPEVILLPKWAPFNIYEMSSWSRTILIPLSLLWAYQPAASLPESQQIRELFLTSPEQLPVTMPPSDQLDALKRPSRINWHAVFAAVDRGWKAMEGMHVKPLRRRAIAKASRWMLDRFGQSDGLGAIFPPIIWSIVALKCLGYADDAPEVQAAHRELEKLTIHEEETARLEPCRSPVWDTCISVIALREACVPADDPRIRRAVDWLLSKEVRSKGDWSVKMPDVEPGGWYFEFNNEFYPDIDDTIMVTMALARCLPGDLYSTWQAQFVPTTKVGTPDGFSTIVCGKTARGARACSDLERMRPMIAAMTRAVKWIEGMQCRDGGWAAFDRDNDRELLTRVPFADHNAMIDPPTADITARVLEMYGRLGFSLESPHLARALEFVWSEQEKDFAWYGRWGVNYLYGTWQCLVGLHEIGVPESDSRIRAAADWLKAKQQANGGWGETARSYDEPHLRGEGPTTASQTAWALMGLMAAGEVESDAIRRGVRYLLNAQEEDGGWNEPEFTGTGFPRVFYLRYHLYRIYFPLMALGRYARLTGILTEGQIARAIA
ncbi:prenyltransferase/squalene oxidase repeat-containing protein [Planctomyces sp. SH-PL14]|uniref:terpene cyclase/mutase family protein n=1 Tax=Planctomyces sp. SH-PL14 TaxID=1632864 RepID=UPI00078EA535|nr:terpene cyclase/mutase family protein [Planctomyces sp. SH-PL14]AMV22717.1 Squalene--hopene cyclase [Planctomyces sp. SH-PL14]